MKKSFFIGFSLLITLLFAGCTLTDQPTNINQTPTPSTVEEITGDIEDETVVDSVFPEKESKYSWSWHMDKPDLTDMDNFVEMLN